MDFTSASSLASSLVWIGSLDALAASFAAFSAALSATFLAAFSAAFSFAANSSAFSATLVAFSAASSAAFSARASSLDDVVPSDASLVWPTLVSVVATGEGGGLVANLVVVVSFLLSLTVDLVFSNDFFSNKRCKSDTMLAVTTGLPSAISARGKAAPCLDACSTGLDDGFHVGL